MFLIFFILSEFTLPAIVQTSVGLIGGALMIIMGLQTFLNRNKTDTKRIGSSKDALIAGIKTTAANPAFILWWLTIGTTLILNAKYFGFSAFSVFASVHWLCDFAWYTAVGVVIFKSRRFWTKRTSQAILFFCVAVLVGFGSWFLGSALWQLTYS
jgi:threonine/homoserine/homoserine lactone efflux protein